jgi:hypothetical protein
MAANPILMRLCLALHARALPGDQELMLRMCLVNGKVTVAGDQLLHPDRPQRAVERGDLERWFSPGASAERRTPQAIANDGICVVDAHRLAAPLRPTIAGHELMQRSFREFPRLLQPGARELLRQRLPELVYACRTNIALLHHMRMSDRTLKSLVSADILKAAKLFRTQAAAAEIVELP